MSVLVLDRLDPSLRHEITVPAGATLEEMVGLALPSLPDTQMVRVTIGEHVVERRLWPRVRPRPGAPVIIRLLPGNSGILRSVLTIAVVVAATLVSGGLLGPAGLGLSAFGSGTLAASLAAAGTLIVGNLLVNALIPSRTDSISDVDGGSPTYSIQGLRNVANPDGPVPRLLGDMRFAPIYLGLPYTEVIGNDRYVIASFLFGYGPLEISDFQIGDTPIASFADVQMEVRSGYPGDAPLSLYPQQVIEESLSINLTNAGGAVARWTASDCTEASVDITFSQGLIAILESGQKLPASVNTMISYRKDGVGDWTDVVSFSVTNLTQQPFARSFRWTFPERGQYEVRLRRDTFDFDNVPKITASGRTDWTALRSFRPEYPVNFDKPIAVAAVRIRASNQLNGTLDTLNARVKSLLPDWDSGTQAWVVRATRNPAAHFRYVLTGNAIAYPVSTDEMEAIEDWHEWCAAKGLTYDRVHDYKASVIEVLSDIAAAGRATPQDRAGTWSVVIDRIQTVVRAHITPRNSWGFSGQRPFVTTPDAFRVKFKDRTNGWADAERIVPWPGFTGSPVVTEDLALPGLTDPDLIWREARRRQYEIMHRRDTHTVNQDFEMLAIRRGDLVRHSQTVLDRHQVSARVVAVIDGAFVEVDEDVSMEAAFSYAARFRLEDGTSLLRTVETRAGTGRLLRLTGTGSLPSPGDLMMFGLAASETFEAIVKSVEPAGKLKARITLVDHAPEIETLTDAEVPPAWNGRVGSELDPSTTAPGVPVISSVISGVLSGTDAIVVSVAPGSGIVVPVSYSIRHRETGAGSWTTVTIPAGAGAAYIEGYAIGDSVDLGASANAFSGSSAYSATTTHVVGADDPTVQDVTSLTAEWTGTAWRYSWALETLADGMDEAAGVRLRFGYGTGLAWADLTALHTGLLSASPWEISLPPELDTGDSYTFGIVAVTIDGREGTRLIITVTA